MAIIKLLLYQSNTRPGDVNKLGGGGNVTAILGSPILGFILEAGLISAFIGVYLNRLSKKMDVREQNRIEESFVCMSMLKALGHLSEALAIAQQEGRTNGEMKTALKYYTEARDDLNAYVMRTCAERIHAR